MLKKKRAGVLCDKPKQDDDMKLTDIVREMNLKPVTEVSSEGIEIAGGYASDLLSDVMGRAEADSLWFTIQKHPNIIAVAALKDLGGIVLTCDIFPDEDTVIKAKENNLPVFTTALTTFEAAGKLYAILNK